MIQLDDTHSLESPFVLGGHHTELTGSLPDSDGDTSAVAESTSETEAPLLTHSHYFWEFVKFEVQGVMFQLPKHPFIRDSGQFGTMYGLCDDRVAADKDTGYIRLEVNLEDFESFLKAFLPNSTLLPPPNVHVSDVTCAKVELTSHEWVSVLKLATKWEFNELRGMAIDSLTIGPMDPIDQICLAREYSVYNWLLSGYHDLIRRSAKLTRDEAKRIGWEEALQLSGIMIDALSAGRAASPDHVLKVFASELETVKESEQRYLTKTRILETEERERQDREEAVKLAKREEKRLAEQKKKEAEEARRREQKELLEREEKKKEEEQKAIHEYWLAEEMKTLSKEGRRREKERLSRQLKQLEDYEEELERSNSLVDGDQARSPKKVEPKAKEKNKSTQESKEQTSVPIQSQGEVKNNPTAADKTSTGKGKGKKTAKNDTKKSDGSSDSKKKAKEGGGK